MGDSSRPGWIRRKMRLQSPINKVAQVLAVAGGNSDLSPIGDHPLQLQSAKTSPSTGADTTESLPSPEGCLDFFFHVNRSMNKLRVFNFQLELNIFHHAGLILCAQRESDVTIHRSRMADIINIPSFSVGCLKLLTPLNRPDRNDYR